MLTIAMAANLGGSLAPSCAARNLIMMGYTEDMFGFSITFVQNNLILQLTGIRFGIGVLAVMGGIAYIPAGVVNW